MSSKRRIDFQRVTELEIYVSQVQSLDITIIVLSLFIGDYTAKIPSVLVICLSILKLTIMTICAMIEKRGEPYYATIRTVQFWIYRVIFLLQLVFVVWIVIQEVVEFPP